MCSKCVEALYFAYLVPHEAGSVRSLSSGWVRISASRQLYVDARGGLEVRRFRRGGRGRPAGLSLRLAVGATGLVLAVAVVAPRVALTPFLLRSVLTAFARSSESFWLKASSETESVCP